MRIQYRAKALLVYVFVAIGIVLGVAPPAHAYSTIGFSAYGPELENSVSFTEGSFTWYNRTANVQGHVVDLGWGSTTAIFEAYAGDRKIDSETRTANDTTDLTWNRSFNFTIGDTDLVGGINLIKVTVCKNMTGFRPCGTSKYYPRP